MTSCIPIRVLLVYDGILQYSFGFGLYTPTGRDITSAKIATRQLAVEYSRITDYVHSRDDSFQRVPSGIILNPLSVTTVCQCRHKLHRTVSLSWRNVLSCIPCTSPADVECHSFVARKAGHSVQTYIFSPFRSSHQK